MKKYSTIFQSSDYVNGSPITLNIPKYAPSGISPASSHRPTTPEPQTLDGRGDFQFFSYRLISSIIQFIDRFVSGRGRTRPSFLAGLKQKVFMRPPSRAQSLDRAKTTTLSPTDVTYHPPVRSISSPRQDDAPSTSKISESSKILRTSNAWSSGLYAIRCISFLYAGFNIWKRYIPYNMLPIWPYITYVNNVNFR